MKVVVELSKEEMESYKNLMRLGFGNSVMRKIINGTPLPEGHGRLIDADKVEDITWQEPSYYDALNVLTEVRDRVRALPTIIEADKEGAEE